MVASLSSKQLTLRAVLRDASPMVIVEISDQLRLAEFHDIFRRCSAERAIWVHHSVYTGRCRAGLKSRTGGLMAICSI